MRQPPKLEITGSNPVRDTKQKDEVVSDWIKGLPNSESDYWLYSYRYGKISCGNEEKPELQLLKVRKISNGFMMIADGQFVWGHEVEEPYYKVAELPTEFPY